jgi:hypothetical protein
MRRGILILALGVIGAAIAFCCFYLMGTATPRALMRSEQPELAWLQHEFNLNATEMKRVSALHAGYLPQCKDRCRRIDQLNVALTQALAAATQLTPEIQKLLDERAQMRAVCQGEMLKHFFEVSRTMPPEQGRRYLAWVRESTCLHELGMEHSAENHAEMVMPGPRP